MKITVGRLKRLVRESVAEEREASALLRKLERELLELGFQSKRDYEVLQPMGVWPERCLVEFSDESLSRNATNTDELADALEDAGFARVETDNTEPLSWKNALSVTMQLAGGAS